MGVTAEMVKSLREKTGAGIMDCKAALGETAGDVDKAIDYLRTKGLASADKKAGRIASEGVVASYIHAGGKIGVLLEINCETDFVARTDDFQEFVNNIALHIAAANPQYLQPDEIPNEQLEKEKGIFRAQALESGKPEKIIEKIIAGKIKKYTEECSLMTQAFVKDTDKTIAEYLKETITSVGEKINIRRFMRFQLGEGLEKKSEDFAEEVRKQMAG